MLRPHGPDLPQIRSARLFDFQMMLDRRRIGYSVRDMRLDALLLVDGKQISEKLAQDVWEHGHCLFVPLVASREGCLLDGYTRHAALRHGGAATTSCIVVDLPFDELVALVRAFNGH